MVAGRRDQHHFRRVVGGVFSPAARLMIAVFCFKPAGRRLARPGRSAAEDVSAMSGALQRGAPSHFSPQGRGEGVHLMRGGQFMTAQTAARRQRSHGGIHHPARHRQGGAARQYRRGQGRDARHCRRNSGSGKSVTSYAVMRILDPRRQDRRRLGDVLRRRCQGSDRGPDARSARSRNVDDFPEPGAWRLNPIRKIGRQIEDVLLQHVQVDRGAGHRPRDIAALEQVKIARPPRALSCLSVRAVRAACASGVVIALGARPAIPQLLIADEPTTGLDVTTQKAVMDLVVETDQAAKHVDDPDHA